MGRRVKTIAGTCRLCGVYGPLSFEHVPPRSAFNNRRVLSKRAADIRDIDLYDRSGQIQQRGAGAYTLCVKCNNDTGSWYGPAYADWAIQGMTLLDRAALAPSLYFTYHLYPLRVLKQITSMFFSTNAETFREAQPELEKFVLSRAARGIPPQVGIFAFLTSSEVSRRLAVCATRDFDFGAASVFSEVTFRPFGYLMALGSPPPDSRLVDISFFASFGYHECKSLSLRLPLLNVASTVPADYRSREELEAIDRKHGEEP